MTMHAPAPLPPACPGPEDWSAFHLGQLPEEDVSRLALHLENCSNCAANLQALEGQADDLVKGLRQPATEDGHGDEPALREAMNRLRELVHRSPGGTDTPTARRLGPYRLLRQLGRGSMGTVFKAESDQLDRVVALKILTNWRKHDPSTAARFRREIEAVRRLDDPHVITAIDAGEAEGVLYLAMEFAEGVDLARLLRERGPPPVADACELARQAALGLHHAHTHGLVHRDVKPSNLLLGHQGLVKVLDLGLALPPPADRPDAEALTTTGQGLGTLDYMAPAPCPATHAVDARADVYSLGCTLYHLLTGHVPFVGPGYQNPQSKMWAHAYEAPPPLAAARPAVGPELANLVERMLA